MKTTEVIVTVLCTNSLFVRVRTDEGVTGIGECSPMNCCAVKALVDHALADGFSAIKIHMDWHAES